MTPAERRKEWHVAYDTALGRMGLTHKDTPTCRQAQKAKIEADQHVAACEEQESLDRWKAKQKGTK